MPKYTGPIDPYPTREISHWDKVMDYDPFEPKDDDGPTDGYNPPPSGVISTRRLHEACTEDDEGYY